MRELLSLFLVFFLSACGIKLHLPEEFMMDEDEFKDLNITYDWYKAYDNTKLNEFLTFVLSHNNTIKKARSTLLTALARTNLIHYDLYPSLGANLSLNQNFTSNIQNTNFNLHLNYELDLFAKIRASVDASEFRARASAYDLEKLKISIMNTALNNVFELAYFNDVKTLLEESLMNFKQIEELYKYKFELGKIKGLDLLNIEQNVLKLKNNLLRNEQNMHLLIKNLQDLIGKEEGFAYIDHFKNLRLADFKNLHPNFNIPLKALIYRPDVRSKFNKLKSAFKDYNAMQKSLFPTVSLAKALSTSGKKIEDAFEFEILSGTIKISLPFLDYAKIKQNIKISQLHYEAMLFDYEQSLQTAMNEFDLNYKHYQSDTNLVKNLEQSSIKQELITNIYWQKYHLGKGELKDYLNASNALNSAKEELLAARFSLLKTINLYYQITALNYHELP